MVWHSRERLNTLRGKPGKGKVPVQLFGDFCENRVSTALGEVTPSICGEWTFANLREVLPTFIGDSLVEGIRASERKIHGFSRSGTPFFPAWKRVPRHRSAL